MDSLFDLNKKANEPLAERMRPRTLDEFVGQEHIVGKGSMLRRAIVTDRLGSCIFYGPPGCGKTTLAGIIAATTGANFVQLNAVSSGVADAKRVIEDAKRALELYGTRTYLMLDECHRWNKAQSDSMLAAIEKGYIVFIGSTTENPYVNMTRAIVSRCRVFEFKRLSGDDVKRALLRAVEDRERGLGNYDIKLEERALEHFVWAADGDLRNALNALELAALTTDPDRDGRIVIDLEAAQQSIQKKAMSVDESMYYDMLSAFCKSLRGSDSDAALYWAERLIAAGCDPLSIARRTLVHSDGGSARAHRRGGGVDRVAKPGDARGQNTALRGDRLRLRGEQVAERDQGSRSGGEIGRRAQGRRSAARGQGHALQRRAEDGLQVSPRLRRLGGADISARVAQRREALCPVKQRRGKTPRPRKGHQAKQGLKSAKKISSKTKVATARKSESKG